VAQGRFNDMLKIAHNILKKTRAVSAKMTKYSPIIISED